jgi:hemoglobin
MNSSQTMYDLIGGDAQVRAIVETFYSKVQQHPLLAPLFPADINPVMEKQHQFLTQLLGGPALYSERHGHPMMRARHLAFPIDQSRADAWLACMNETLTELGLNDDIRKMLMERFTGMAYHFMNR